MRTAYKILSLFFAFGVLIFLSVRLGYEGDTQELVSHVQGILDCLHHGIYVGCGLKKAGGFVIFQYLPSALIALLGGGRGAILHVLCYLSLASFLLSFFVMHRSLSHKFSLSSPRTAWMGVLILASGFNLRYANLSFGEMAASFVILTFVALLLQEEQRSSALGLGFFGFLAALTKDTAFPFLLLLLAARAVCCDISAAESRGRSLSEWIGVGVAILIGAGVNSIFNYFRFGSVLNQAYLRPDFIVQNFGLQLHQFFGIWFSPFGGVAIFWPSFMLLLLVWFGRWLMGPSLTRRRLEYWGPGLCIIALLLLQTWGLSKWYAPFGNIAWGERLLLPWIPAVTLWILWFYGEELGKVVETLVSKRVMFWTVGLGLAAASFPQYAILLRHSLIGKVVEPAACAGRVDSGLCALWQPWPWGIIEFYKPFPRPELFVLAAFMSSWVVALLGRGSEERVD